ncbi:MAG TPA: hypothetical protein PLL30_17940, partial [Candidatus Krumholzibacteria bacterium]|nr:hypothetical protein [Candidatus Krumholzibacteria bacterium]HPD73661.1 hypothetical protein [Candidatus Krumholzibacteria bacterium]HRY42297.1 hypothetical protein [Candidatus Krumholzibacteria bacterium]
MGRAWAKLTMNYVNGNCYFLGNMQDDQSTCSPHVRNDHEIGRGIGGFARQGTAGRQRGPILPEDSRDSGDARCGKPGIIEATINGGMDVMRFLL